MKTFLSLIVMAVILFAASCNSGSSANETKNDSTQVSNVIPISDFEKVAKTWVDKEIIINGTVSHICKHGGKKMFLFTPPNDTVTVKITTTQSFDKTLEGSDLKVTGIVREERVTEAECVQIEIDAEKALKEDGDKEHYQGKLDEAKELREEIKASGTDHVSYYSIEYVKHEVIK